MSSSAATNAGAEAHPDQHEVRKFDALAARFWDPHGEFRPLHMLNPVRTRFIAQHAQLSGARLLDVGCGGGMLTESLHAAGAHVTGIDLAPGMIEVARLHASHAGLAIDYRMASAEQLQASGGGAFDVITCMEMLEHVSEPDRTMQTLAQLLRPGGALFVSTLNRNLRSFLLAIVGAEYVLGLIPRGTHEYEKLILPSELARWARAAGLTLHSLAGIALNPFTGHAAITHDVGVNYLAHFVRTGAA